jgi:hypothetical protein
MFRNKFVLKLENNNRGVLTGTRSKLEKNLRIRMREKSSCGFAEKFARSLRQFSQSSSAFQKKTHPLLYEISQV